MLKVTIPLSVCNAFWPQPSAETFALHTGSWYHCNSILVARFGGSLCTAASGCRLPKSLQSPSGTRREELASLGGCLVQTNVRVCKAQILAEGSLSGLCVFLSPSQKVLRTFVSTKQGCLDYTTVIIHCKADSKQYHTRARVWLIAAVFQ